MKSILSQQQLKKEIMKKLKSLESLVDLNKDVKIEIIAAPNVKNCSCESCLGLHGKQYGVQEFLGKMPIPNPNCVHEYGCRCSYGIIINS